MKKIHIYTTICAVALTLSSTAFANSNGVYSPESYGQDTSTPYQPEAESKSDQPDAYQSGQALGKSINNVSETTVGAVKDSGNAVSNWWDGLTNTVKDPTD